MCHRPSQTSCMCATVHRNHHACYICSSLLATNTLHGNHPEAFVGHGLGRQAQQIALTTWQLHPALQAAFPHLGICGAGCLIRRQAVLPCLGSSALARVQLAVQSSAARCHPGEDWPAAPGLPAAKGNQARCSRRRKFHAQIRRAWKPDCYVKAADTQQGACVQPTEACRQGVRTTYLQQRSPPRCPPS